MDVFLARSWFFKFDSNFPDLGDWNFLSPYYYLLLQTQIWFKFPRFRGLKRFVPTCLRVMRQDRWFDSNFPDLGDWNYKRKPLVYGVPIITFDSNFPDLGDWNLPLYVNWKLLYLQQKIPPSTFYTFIFYGLILSISYFITTPYLQKRRNNEYERNHRNSYRGPRSHSKTHRQQWRREITSQ